MGMNTPETISKLLRAIAGGTDAKENNHDVIFLAAARMIEEHERDVQHLKQLLDGYKALLK
jgi:hypothetical protein